jgi:hypothetical protein
MLKRHYKTRPNPRGILLSEREIKESWIETVEGYGPYPEVFQLVMGGKITSTDQIPEEYMTNELVLAIKLG